MKVIELHNREHSQGKHGFTMAMNAFGDMVSVALEASVFVLPVLVLFQNNLFLYNILFPFP